MAGSYASGAKFIEYIRGRLRLVVFSTTYHFSHIQITEYSILLHYNNTQCRRLQVKELELIGTARDMVLQTLLFKPSDT